MVVTLQISSLHCSVWGSLSFFLGGGGGGNVNNLEELGNLENLGHSKQPER